MTEDSPTEPDIDGSPGVIAWELLLRVHAELVPILNAQLERECALPLPWYDVLLELHRAGTGPLRMQDLADRVVLSRSRVSRIIDAMAASGLVGRTSDVTDGRVVLASLTDEGRMALRVAAPVYLSAIQRHFVDRLRPNEIAAMRRALARVLGPTVGPYTAPSSTRMD